jgi:outer membrane protein assembly factor BamB
VLWNYRRPAAQGSVLWSLRGSGTPIVSENGKVIYVGFSDGTVVALESSSGQTVWERAFGDRPGRFKDADMKMVLSENGENLYLSLVDGDLVALKASNGANLWTLSLKTVSAPFVDEKEGALYVSSLDGSFNKVSLKDSRIIWSVALRGQGLCSSATAVLDSFVAINCTKSGLSIVDRRDGQIVWTSSQKLNNMASPAFDGTRLAAVSSRNELVVYKVRARR